MKLKWRNHKTLNKHWKNRKLTSIRKAQRRNRKLKMAINDKETDFISIVLFNWFKGNS